jgi:hypothetical protein
MQMLWYGYSSDSITAFAYAGRRKARPGLLTRGRARDSAARAPEKLLSIHCPDGFYSGTSKTGHTTHVQKGNQNNSNNVLFCSFTFKSGLTIQNVNNHHLLYLRTVEQSITH